MRVAVATFTIAALTVVLAPVARVQHLWFGVERHQDVDLEIDCFVFRADSNGHGAANGPTACSTLFDTINRDNSAAYLVVPDTIASETSWLEVTTIAVVVFLSVGNLLSGLGHALPQHGGAARRLAIQAHIMAAAAGVFALNSSIRFVRELDRPHDPNGATHGHVGFGLYVIIAMPVIMLAHGSRVKID